MHKHKNNSYQWSCTIYSHIRDPCKKIVKQETHNTKFKNNKIEKGKIWRMYWKKYSP
jgi:hypothetical protein